MYCVCAVAAALYRDMPQCGKYQESRHPTNILYRLCLVPPCQEATEANVVQPPVKGANRQD